MVKLTGTEAQHASWALSTVIDYFRRSMTLLLEQELLVFDQKAFMAPFYELGDILRRGNPDPVEVPDDHLPTLKLVLQYSRRKKATEIEEAKEKTSNPEIKEKLDSELIPLNKLLSQDWVAKVEAMRMPRLSDYLNHQRLRQIRKNPHWSKNLPRLLPRDFDEKFGILQPARLFLPDLAYFRDQCAQRDRPLVVAYLDIDDFKKRFNTPYTEPIVDREVLAPLMRTLEAHVFQHGYGYRYGGDEYVLLLINFRLDMAARLIHQLRRSLRGLRFRGIPEPITLSSGLCEITPQTFLTEREIEHKANIAKNFAKKNKDDVAAYAGDLFQESDLFIVKEE